MALPTKPMTPAPTRPMTPTPAPVNPAMQRQQQNQAFVNQLNARDGQQRLVDPNAMKAAVDKNMALRQATDSRLAAEAARNTIPATTGANAGLNRSINAIQSRSAAPVARAKGGKVKSASARADGCCIRGKTRA